MNSPTREDQLKFLLAGCRGNGGHVEPSRGQGGVTFGIGMVASTVTQHWTGTTSISCLWFIIIIGMSKNTLVCTFVHIKGCSNEFWSQVSHVLVESVCLFDGGVLKPSHSTLITAIGKWNLNKILMNILNHCHFLGAESCKSWGFPF